MELFGRDGFDRTTVRAIAERCGISDPALYYHFKTKRAILTALWVSPPFPALANRYVPGRKLTHEALAALVDTMIDGMVGNDSLMRILIRSILSGDQTAHALRESSRAAWRQALLPYFETVFDKEEATVRVDAFMMLMIGFVQAAQIDHGPRFAEVAARPEFREEVKHLVRLSVPLPREAW
ncbi:MAG: hypothetical protein C0506_00620 [Anaerolinea sp.]|nr:hypothetical protein [Anaerolinea sp.]